MAARPTWPARPRRGFVTILALGGTVAAPCAAGAQSAGSPWTRTATDTVAPGIVHERYSGTVEALDAHVVTVDLHSPDIHLESARANDARTGRERTSAMARRHSSPGDPVIVAINADFFNLETGEIENNQVVRGKLVRGTPITDSPHDTFDNVHSQFAVSRDGRPLIDRFRFEGRALLDGGSLEIDRLNSDGESTNVVLFTEVPASGVSATSGVTGIWLDPLPSRGDTLMFGVRNPGHAAAPADDAGAAILAGVGEGAPSIGRMLAPADTLGVLLGFRPDRGAIRTLVGGWPRIVTHGRNVAAGADSVEGTFPRFSRARHPRTAVGISADSSRIYLVVVDGRQESSVGMSLEELADFIVDVGAYEALNLDGGGSTTLVIDGEVVNSPSDEEGERPVANALLIHHLRRPPR